MHSFIVGVCLLSVLGQLVTNHKNSERPLFNLSVLSRVWPAVLRLSCVTNFDMLFLIMVSLSLFHKIYIYANEQRPF